MCRNYTDTVETDILQRSLQSRMLRNINDADNKASFLQYIEEEYDILSNRLESYKRILESRLRIGFILRSREHFDTLLAEKRVLNMMLFTAESLLSDIRIKIDEVMEKLCSDRPKTYFSFAIRCIGSLEQNLYDLAAMLEHMLDLCAHISNSSGLFMINELIGRFSFVDSSFLEN
ncbi:hypothetical protein NPIL_251751 [Nephila pilipes]|uniref:Uncharacterized protein n=1 Tax=Nephila pilipes TaxID=299642 RepID=A0A8X6T9M7_NEPPI|nr:hypothetical protein NPIL_251751 [Nephila pilipes]